MITTIILAISIILISSYYIGNKCMDSFDESFALKLTFTIIGLGIVICFLCVLGMLGVIYLLLTY